MSRLLQHENMTERFRLPLEQEEAKHVLLAAMKSQVELRGKEFEVNSHVMAQADAIAEWLTGDNQKIGLLLCGGVGNGKTTFVRAFQKILTQLDLRTYNNEIYRGMRIIDAKSIVHLCKTDYRKWEEISAQEMLAIDDLGIEPLEVYDYGNILSPMVDLLTRRYDKQLFTIITTNLTPQEIRAKYGDRIADRLNEMMFKVIFGNSTYRK